MYTHMFIWMFAWWSRTGICVYTISNITQQQRTKGILDPDRKSFDLINFNMITIVFICFTVIVSLLLCIRTMNTSSFACYQNKYFPFKISTKKKVYSYDYHQLTVLVSVSISIWECVCLFSSLMLVLNLK